MAQPIKHKLLTIGEFIAWSGVCRSRVYQMLANGSLQAIKIGRSTRIPSANALAWLDSQQPFPTNSELARADLSPSGESK